MKTTENSILMLIFFLCLIISTPAIARERVTELQQKIADINLLQSQLNERKNDAVKIRENLYHHLSTLRTEIETITTQKRIKTFNGAKAHSRVFYNLQLSAEIHSYIGQINQKIRSYQIGLDKLDYLYQLADDDLKIINTLTNLKIEALLIQIDAVISEYLPEAHRILISLKNLDSVEPVMIWKKIIGN
jgi:hypothetical protein